MPYKYTKEIQTPPDDTVVWRYFGQFQYFKKQIDTNTLSFSRDNFFPDPNEGRFTRKYEENFSPNYYSTTVQPSICGPTIIPLFSPGSKKMTLMHTKIKFVNCILSIVGL